MQRYKVTGRLEVYGFAVHFDCIGTSGGFVHAGEVIEMPPPGSDSTVPIVVHDGDTAVASGPGWMRSQHCRVFPGNAEEVERLFQAGFLEVA